MITTSITELERLAELQKEWSLEDARQWCRAYAAAHYENFSVVSSFLPPQTRTAYEALYAFARGADWRADDIDADLPLHVRSEHRLKALDEWQENLDGIYSGKQADHPTFTALGPVAMRYGINRESFARMINAFRIDQTNARFRTWDDLLTYTRGSANPVGHWVLRVHGYRNPALDELSDSVCTGLQLVNFMQDIRSDLLERDRVYLPREDMDRFGVLESMLAEQPSPTPVRRLLAFEGVRAEKLLSAGNSLIARVNGSLVPQLILFHGGGRLALAALRHAEWDAGSQHRRVTRLEKLALVSRALRRRPL